MAYNGETRRLFVGLDNGTISVSFHYTHKPVILFIINSFEYIMV